MKCPSPNCSNTSIQPSDKFCGVCGHPVTNVTASTPASQTFPPSPPPNYAPSQQRAVPGNPPPDGVAHVDFLTATRGGTVEAIVKLNDGTGTNRRISFPIPAGTSNGDLLELKASGHGGKSLRIKVNILATKVPEAPIPWLSTLQPWERKAINTFLDKGLDDAVDFFRNRPGMQQLQADQGLATLLATYNSEAELFVMWGMAGVEAAQREGISAEDAIKKWLGVPNAVLPQGISAPARFTNRLGMEFVPVPGTSIHMSAQLTRVKDYAAYAAKSPGVNMDWKGVDFEAEILKEGDGQLSHLTDLFGDNYDQNLMWQNEDHPVVMVSRQDANDFCAWLTKREGRAYRLPTDHEWSCAAGMGYLEDINADLESKDTGLERFGEFYPPLTYTWSHGPKWDYQASGPGMPHCTFPVGSRLPNRLGIHDLGGNVGEACDPHGHSNNAVRGRCWGPSIVGYKAGKFSGFDREVYDVEYDDDSRSIRGGFRCVVEARM